MLTGKILLSGVEAVIAVFCALTIVGALGYEIADATIVILLTVFVTAVIRNILPW